MEAIQDSGAMSQSRHESTQSEVERLNATLALVRHELREQSAAIKRLREEHANAIGLGESAVVQEKLNALYAAFFRLAVLCVSLQVSHYSSLSVKWPTNCE
jgi:hypothetical protein